MDNAYYLHSDGHLYEVTEKGIRRVRPKEPKLGCLFVILMGSALWVLIIAYAYMIWTWARAGGMVG